MTAPRRISEAELEELKARNPCDAYARKQVALRKHGNHWIGRCPVCSEHPDQPGATKFEVWPDHWLCAGGCGGGDIIKLVQLVERLDFVAVVERLGGVRELDPAEAARRAAELERKRLEAERSNADFRERERGTVFEIWKRGRPIAGSAVEQYLALRLGASATQPLLPDGIKLRVIDGMPYYASGARDAEIIGRWPAMLAPIMRTGKFSGLHITYIDLDQPKGKAAPCDGAGGEREPLPAKKVRGSKAGGHIELVGAGDFPANRLVIGEGIEKSLAVWRAERARGEAATLYWTSVDLGNLGGKHAGTAVHPTLRDKAGRPRRVPGPLPDLDDVGITVPDSVEEIVILGDATSDRFTTECALARAAARWARPGRTIKVAWSPDGQDFDDVLREQPFDEAYALILDAIAAAAPVVVPDQVQPSNETKPRRQARPSSASSVGSGAPPGDLPPAGAGADALLQSLQGDHWTTATLALDIEDKLEDQLAACAELDENDVDNGKRLRRYFGNELLAIAQAGQAVGAWLHWSGVHWEYEGGAAGAHIVAQKVGDLIAQEADFMAPTPLERARVDAAEAAARELEALPAPPGRGKPDPDGARRKELAALVKAGSSAAVALFARKIARREFGNQSKNMARIKNMLECAGPHLRLPPDAFNADPLKVATRSHTLTFVRELDAECPDPDAVRWKARLVDVAAHQRSDLITALVPCVYRPDAQGPSWQAFLTRCMPDESKRRTLQAFTGLALTALPVQRLIFHYGVGANGKSVFLEVITRLLGESFAVGLPVESITGMASGTGAGASPDIARLFGKRMLRVHELPQGSLLKAEVIKKLTGGERMTARDLYKGFFEFAPRAKPHMSGNDPPRFDGSDGGMRRRLIYMHWDQVIPEAEQRDFEELVAELLEEAPAILNWLIAGALDYLAHGLFIAEEVRSFTQAAFDEMDPVGQFVAACVNFLDGKSVKAREMYLAYVAWAQANSIPPMKETRFGRIAKKKMLRDDTKRVHVYVGVELHDVPASEPRDGRDAPVDRSGDDIVF
jgi:putative DNA primase/helicase